MKFILLVLAILLILFLLWSPNTNRYVPTASGSGGLSPDGGMRNYTMSQSSLSDQNVTYNEYDVDIYDNHTIPERMIWDIGHWSK
jgi:hypothetical protein